MLTTLKRMAIGMREWAYTLPAPPLLRSLADLLVRGVRSFFRDDGTHMAAGVAYYAFFSLFPMVLGTVAVAGFFISSDEAQARLLDFLAREVPGLGSSEFLRDNISGVVKARGTIGLVSIVALFWSGRAVLGAVHRVVNRAWKLPEPSHFITQQISQLGVGVAIGLMFLLTTGLSILGGVVTSETNLLFQNALVRWVLDVLLGVTPFLLSALVFGFIYHYVTDVKVSWRTALPGAVVAGGLFEAAKLGFVVYLNSFANYERIYGGAATVVVLMFWFYLVAIILVVGAEVSAELQRTRAAGLLTVRGQCRPTRGGLAPYHRRGLPVPNYLAPEHHTDPKEDAVRSSMN
jgi:membrane protein